MFYSIATQRNLTQDEIEIVSTVLKDSKPEWIQRIPKLVVITRCCGCGKCPTAIFDDKYTMRIDIDLNLLKNQNLNISGITLFGDATKMSGIEFW